MLNLKLVTKSRPGRAKAQGSYNGCQKQADNNGRIVAAFWLLQRILRQHVGQPPGRSDGGFSWVAADTCSGGVVPKFVRTASWDWEAIRFLSLALDP